ncbi:S8 family serine peptidase [Candidatus Manganitrophus noduliformans]|uniref:Peptidase S8/S53 domain-containing protein n=1 Tax=Candidatus Manganitrophus noduliformans TaxID=2606439 RepID=A0A7X6DUN9_9BACT|nr:S8 family serine peptidase [Candidatus Manganitrophus noduliformans]NKE73727.1 hypothetical protein [Candidatus Manganitrophus noduliformans]
MEGCMQVQPIVLSRYKCFLSVVFVLFIGLTFFLSACGSGGGGGGAGAPGDPVDPPDGTDPPAIQLAGDPAVLVLPQLPNVSPVRAPLEEVDAGLLLSRVSIVLNRNATVADFNAAAQKLGATAIAYSRTNSPFLTLIVPRQSSGATVKRLAALLRNQPGILLSVPGRQLEGKAFPPGDGAHLDHLWPAGFPAAWNLRALAEADCGSRKVTVLVPDLYAGEPPGGFRDQVPGAAENFDVTPTQPSNQRGVNLHGYEVAAVLAGRFDGTPPTGANPFPDCLKIVPVNLAGLDFFQAVEVLRTAVEREEGKAVVNASVGYPITLCGSAGNDRCPRVAIQNAFPVDLQEQIALRVAAGIAWAEFAAQPTLADEKLLVVAAGNERISTTDTTEQGELGQVYEGFRRARLASPFAVATELPNLPSILADDNLWTNPDSGIPELSLDETRIDQVLQAFEIGVIPPVPDRNLTLVGSATQANVVSDVDRSLFSNDDADLYAVGEGVTGLVSTELKGTSFSAAQVAGLASYLWLLDDDLRSRPVEETLRLIRGTSRANVEPDDKKKVESFIDAYAAVLALDALHQTDQIRKTLLDVNNDSLFNHFDLQEFAESYQVGNPNAPSIPAARDYSRFDLNGDGFTGGILTERFDLDADGLEPNGAPRFTTVTATIGGVAVPLNEAALTDAQILCYYAYGVDSTGAPFYDASGDTDDVRGTLLSRCLGIQMDVDFPNRFETSATLRVTLLQPDGAGGFAPAPGLWVELTPTCATVSDASGLTNTSGEFNATVSFGSGCADLSVVVTAHADEGSPPLAQQTVRAFARGPGVRLNRIATTKGEVTHSGGTLVQDQKTSIYPPEQGRDYTPPAVALNGSGTHSPDPLTSSYTYAADYVESVSASEVESDTVTGGTLRLTASCSADGNAQITVVTTGLVSPYLQFPEGRFRLTLDGTLTGTTSGADFEAKFTLQRLKSENPSLPLGTIQSVTLTTRDQTPSRTFTNSVPIEDAGSYGLGMTAKTFCMNGSPARSAGAEVSVTFSIEPLP